MFKFVVRAGQPALYVKRAFRLPLPHIFEKLGYSQTRGISISPNVRLGINSQAHRQSLINQTG